MEEYVVIEAYDAETKLRSGLERSAGLVKAGRKQRPSGTIKA